MQILLKVQPMYARMFRFVFRAPCLSLWLRGAARRSKETSLPIAVSPSHKRQPDTPLQAASVQKLMNLGGGGRFVPIPHLSLDFFFHYPTS